MRHGLLAFVAAGLVILSPVPAAGQNGDGSGMALRVFLDCERYLCDLDYFRTEITWVNWVRDRTEAEVHLLVTVQGTGGGGREYALKFLGLGTQEGQDDDLRHVTPGTATEEERRRGLVRIVKLGLGPFAARAGADLPIEITRTGDLAGRSTGQQPGDRWNNWVFRVGASGHFSGESRSNSSHLNGSARATRVTDLWKLRFEVEGSRNSNHFVFDDGSTYDSRLTSTGASALAVRSLGPHWSGGLNLSVRRSDSENLERELLAAPGVEYNVFPYAESTRRQLTFLYEVGVVDFRYRDTTVYDRLAETRAGHSLTVTLVSKQPWGSTNLSLAGSTYFDDWSQNQVTLFGSINVRLIKGLEANFHGSYGRVRDQLYLPKEGATDEEVLLRLKQLQTSYRYFVSAGLSYTFGSIFNNIVNPRFGGSR